MKQRTKDPHRIKNTNNEYCVL
ncbi:MAG: hypothetical protein JWP84_4726, partial [Tardiphaga sp.]|nr:hypothetical protein [Tardiphaga sp.]